MQWQTWFGLENRLMQNRFVERKDKMQKKIKIEKYKIYEKGRTYEVLKFPFIKHMWAYDDHPAEKLLLVDGCKEAFEWMTYACAILAYDKNKIIYFPCKQNGIGKYYKDSHHLVMCRAELQFKRSLWFRIKDKLDDKNKIIYFPCKQNGIGKYYKDSHHLVMCRAELQFKRSLWFRIKDKLDKRHYAGKYVFTYHRKKLMDYYESGCGHKHPVEEFLGIKQIPNYLMYSKRNVEEILGDTVFLVRPRLEWLDYRGNWEKGQTRQCNVLSRKISFYAC